MLLLNIILSNIIIANNLKHLLKKTYNCIVNNMSVTK